MGQSMPYELVSHLSGRSGKLRVGSIEAETRQASFFLLAQKIFQRLSCDGDYEMRPHRKQLLTYYNILYSTYKAICHYER